MRYIVILESFLLLHQLQGITSATGEVICLFTEPSPLKKKFFKKIKTPGKDPLKDDTYKKLALNKDDRVIIHVSTTEKAGKILPCILNACNITPIVVLEGNSTASPEICQENISYLSINALLENNVSNEWSNITNRQRTSTIRSLTRNAENILILIQHDPDPDALASGLGLRTLLGRNRATAPIGSFGKVTRSENLNMMRLLDMRYTIVDSQSLHNYAMVAMVEVQPPLLWCQHAQGGYRF